MAPSSRSVVPVWIVTAIGAVAVVAFAPEDGLVWLPIVMVGAILLSFVIQLGLRRREGFVERVMSSLGGALVVLVVATGALWAIGAFADAAAPCACV